MEGGLSGWGSTSMFSLIRDLCRFNTRNEVGKRRFTAPLCSTKQLEAQRCWCLRLCLSPHNSVLKGRPKTRGEELFIFSIIRLLPAFCDPDNTVGLQPGSANLLKRLLTKQELILNGCFYQSYVVRNRYASNKSWWIRMLKNPLELGLCGDFRMVSIWSIEYRCSASVLIWMPL